ncbi:MAG: FCD domain-containing protein [Betaproteobacteria bacterium]|nr:FCD domain-containing protein [Betaproteobacteria bacterium]
MATEISVLAQTLPEKIAAAVANRVVSGEYQAGERLIESILVKSFNVSHGPIRDALRILQNSGLVTIHPYRGAQVTELSVREVKEIYQVRAALVGLRARWIAEDAGRHELIAQLQQPIARLAELARAPDKYDEYVEAAMAVNSALTESLTNRWLRDMLRALTLQTRRYTRLALASAERRKDSARLWRQLLEAIKSGDGERAQRIASRISLATRDAAIRHLQETTRAG